jgi:hypothetical protein
MSSHAPDATRPTKAATPITDLRESGAPIDGVPQFSDRRLFIQLQVFDGCARPQDLFGPLQACALDVVLYRDLNHPGRVGVLMLAEDPAELINTGGGMLVDEPFASLCQKPELAMTGRTYSIGYEPDLDDYLLTRPRKRVLDPDLPWAIWYPLRRKPEFYQLAKEEQGKILREHGAIGRTYVEAGHGYDVRMACFGLDEHDNDFVIGLVGADLYPLSRLVQEMRRTKQTSQYLDSLGPFFVGKVCWQSALPGT